MTSLACRVASEGQEHTYSSLRPEDIILPRSSKTGLKVPELRTNDTPSLPSALAFCASPYTAPAFSIQRGSLRSWSTR